MTRAVSGVVLFSSFVLVLLLFTCFMFIFVAVSHGVLVFCLPGVVLRLLLACYTYLLVCWLQCFLCRVCVGQYPYTSSWCPMVTGGTSTWLT